MIARGANSGMKLPRSWLPPALGFIGISAALLVWASLDVQLVSDGATPISSPVPKLSSVAYILHEPLVDRVQVQKAEPGAVPQTLAMFKVPLGLHAHGSVSPDGQTILVLHGVAEPGRAALSVVNVSTGRIDALFSPVDFQTNIVWDRDGKTVAVGRSLPPDDVGRVQTEIFSIDTETKIESHIATFDSVFEAAPVGFLEDSMLVVTIDQSGSALTRVTDGKAAKVAQLSVGRTRGWTLHPDGVRLAFLDVIGAGAGRAVVAKVILLSTGQITSLPGEDDHFGIVWRPGLDIPDIGGPGGSVQLSDSEGSTTPVHPISWAPDGSRLLVQVPSGSQGQAGHLEILSNDTRLWLVEGEIVPLGWVADVQ